MVDVDDANNLPIIDGKLGEDIRITQSYLMNYIIHKQGVWYLSSGYVNSIAKNNKTCFIKLKKENGKELLTATISDDKCNVKKGQQVNFVGTIDIETKTLELSKISKEDINYSSATTIDIDDLISHINLVSSNNFIVSGYLVTEGNNYYLYNDKGDYTSKSKDYFLINWKKDFLYTGNADIVITCNIVNSYTLNNCVYND